MVDPLGGSYYIESLTDKIENEVSNYLREIDSAGGIIKAVESGWMQAEIARSAYQKQREIEGGKRVIVGVNKFVSGKEPVFAIHRPDLLVAEEMKRRIRKLREERDNLKVQRSLEELRQAAQGKENLVPFILEAVRNYATIGEICSTLCGVLGRYSGEAF